jgi:DNA polymerase-3 subunit delta'
MLFSEILGQEKPISYLQKLTRTQRVPGSFLFYGKDGIGKKQVALAFAQALNCEDTIAREQGTACGVCPSCRAISKGTHPDVLLIDFLYQARLEIKKDTSAKNYEEDLEKELAKQQHINVDTVRDACTRAQQKSFGSGWKVLIIDEAQTMLPAAANALLKFIEEPPAKTVWILITSKREAMLPTIRSRCQPVGFAPLAEENLKNILHAQNPDLPHLELAARYAGGSVSGAIRASAALEMLKEGEFGELQAPIQIAAALPRTLVTARVLAQSVLDVLILALHRAWAQEQNPQQQAHLQKMLGSFEKYKQAISRNVSPALVLETALMGLDETPISIF